MIARCTVRILATAISAAFTSTAVDGGKVCDIAGAGVAGAHLLTTISTVTNSTTAVLAASASTGVESPDDVFKYLLAGADVVMTTSSLLRHGVGHMRTLLDGLTA